MASKPVIAGFALLSLGLLLAVAGINEQPGDAEGVFGTILGIIGLVIVWFALLLGDSAKRQP